jgi:hypothetical protein
MTGEGVVLPVFCARDRRAIRVGPEKDTPPITCPTQLSDHTDPLTCVHQTLVNKLMFDGQGSRIIPDDLDIASQGRELICHTLLCGSLSTL